jgi:undecaprenyl diphosphate synthase
MQSNAATERGLHLAIIMDGNGRWAERRALPRSAGHRAGMRALRRAVEAAPATGVSTLTLFAFSADNWRRPAAEVQSLMALLSHYLRRETIRLRDSGVRLSVIGRRDRLPAGITSAIAAAEHGTRLGTRLHLRIAIDYSSRDAIARAAARLAGTGIAGAEFGAGLGETLLQESGAPHVDLMIRTSGEQRLSDFLLWESAYAELWFTTTPWPDFDASALAAAVRAFHQRERRFGGLSQSSAGETQRCLRAGKRQPLISGLTQPPQPA